MKIASLLLFFVINSPTDIDNISVIHKSIPKYEIFFALRPWITMCTFVDIMCISKHALRVPQAKHIPLYYLGKYIKNDYNTLS